MSCCKTFSIVTKYTTKLNLLRYYIGGFLMNMSTYFFWLVVPLLMQDRDASSFQIALADGITFGLTGIVSPFMGLIADKTDPALMCRISFILQATCSLTIGLIYIKTESILPIYFLLLQQSAALAFFWSPCESLITTESYKGEENKKLSMFALCWSLGKAIGFLLGGTLKVKLGANSSLLLCGGLTLLAYILFPTLPQKNHLIERPKKKKKQNQEDNEKEMNNELNAENISDSETKQIGWKERINRINHPQPPRFILYYFINALILHFHVYGTIAILCNQYILYAVDREIILNGLNDDPEVYLSVFLGIIYFSQTICFFIIGYIEAWQYKMILSTIMSIVLGLVCLALNFIKNGWVCLIFAIPTGFISGLDLQMNVLYSVKVSAKRRGLMMGLVEMVGELTCCLSPVIAGLISTQTDNLEWSQWVGLIWGGIATVGCLITQTLNCIVLKKQKELKKEVEENDVEIDIDSIKENNQNSEETIKNDEDKVTELD
ncbi:hypothetical protein ENUP19_0020G0052 [Entamoeba nuttalli]|uniref:Transporter, major facilitator family protein n=2 Tax=Entamoeba nuttalli TaxID=412467 RepID=K2GEM7_ENTNP|nr:transporter, major facilitator family protein [Entamoeba nuttalli P19]EKE41071.1 transporter, major facilitator family protein [Entamoeba nuttalli P19]|eukprot:XP_008856594.1 transporter, major facilitator family protein [Entamoeba nuttalli P19]